MRKIAALVFPGFELLDLFGPLQMFGMMKNDFRMQIVAQSKSAVESNAGPQVFAEADFEDAIDYDLILIPGGMGARQEINNIRLIDWIVTAAGRAELTMSVCTGSALLAKSGVLDGRRATTNKMAFDWVSSQSTAVDWQKQARWVEDGTFYTSSGVSAGVDMSLAVIARLHGKDQARKVATWSEYEWHEEAGRDPFAQIHGLV
ncbi:DJ-1/PfpI family protein [uncultured Sneathiella sp.]|uniref:DJ-1/PfpI family protein n=1 Tax=uncultured Sneathiella sp. TaxID=879315 RepID=UPI0030EC9F51